jgi:hypothetical protein
MAQMNARLAAAAKAKPKPTPTPKKSMSIIDKALSTGTGAMNSQQYDEYLKKIVKQNKKK